LLGGPPCRRRVSSSPGRSFRRQGTPRVLLATAAALAAAPAARADDGNRHTPTRVAPRLVARGGVARARAWALGRAGVPAFAVLDEDGNLRGLRLRVRYPSASVVKAMLLVAELRHLGRHRVPAAERALLSPMIRVSDNKAAEAVYDQVGRAGLLAVARRARMRDFSVPFLFDAQLTAADQARFFLRIDKLVPRAHRAYARALLASIVRVQSWGIAPVGRRRRYRVFFKGGWRTGIIHQVALLERDGRRVALAVLTRSPGMAYGEATIAGIAARVLAR
jgi:hypothetical protein